MIYQRRSSNHVRDRELALMPVATQARHVITGFGFGMGAFLGGVSLGLLWVLM